MVIAYAHSNKKISLKKLWDIIIVVQIVTRYHSISQPSGVLSLFSLSALSYLKQAKKNKFLINY